MGETNQVKESFQDKRAGSCMSNPFLEMKQCKQGVVKNTLLVKMSQPHFEGSVRSPLTLPKMGLRNPLGLPKLQSSIVGVKTPRIEVFFIPLERSGSVHVQNGLT